MVETHSGVDSPSTQMTDGVRAGGSWSTFWTPKVGMVPAGEEQATDATGECQSAASVGRGMAATSIMEMNESIATTPLPQAQEQEQAHQQTTMIVTTAPSTTMGQSTARSVSSASTSATYLRRLQKARIRWPVFRNAHNNNNNNSEQQSVKDHHSDSSNIRSSRAVMDVAHVNNETLMYHRPAIHRSNDLGTAVAVYYGGQMETDLPQSSSMDDLSGAQHPVQRVAELGRPHHIKPTSSFQRISLWLTGTNSPSSTAAASASSIMANHHHPLRNHSSSLQHQAKHDDDLDSLADFDESEWTPPDSSYGAAIPIGGCIPKPIRRLIECTLIAVAIVGIVYLVITTSIRWTDENASRSYHHHHHTNNNGGVSSSNVETTNGAYFDDDLYLEYHNDDKHYHDDQYLDLNNVTDDFYNVVDDDYDDGYYSYYYDYYYNNDDNSRNNNNNHDDHYNF